jgi:hypothetical protein
MQVLMSAKNIVSSPAAPAAYQLTSAQFRLLELLQSAEGHWTIARLCREAGIHRASFYRWQREPGFAYQLAKMSLQHVAVSLPVLLARRMNTALGGDNQAAQALLQMFASPKAMESFNANLERLARLASLHGASNTRAWDDLPVVGPHHRQSAREQLLDIAHDEDSCADQLAGIYGEDARAAVAEVPAAGAYRGEYPLPVYDPTFAGPAAVPAPPAAKPGVKSSPDKPRRSAATPVSSSDPVTAPAVSQSSDDHDAPPPAPPAAPVPPASERKPSSSSLLPSFIPFRRYFRGLLSTSRQHSAPFIWA